MVRTTAKRSLVMVLATAGVMGGVLGSREAGAQLFGRFETVAATGQALPAGGGVGSLSQLGTPSINELGSVGFAATMVGTSAGAANDQGVFMRVAGGALRFVAREGQAAPGGNGTIGNVFGVGVHINDSNNVMVPLGLTGTSGGTLDDTGFFLFDEATGVLTAGLRENQVLFGGNLGSFQNLTFASNGRVGFSTSLRNTVGGVATDGAIISSLPGLATRLAVEGLITPQGGTFGTINYGGVVQASGLTAFSSTWVGVPGVPSGVYRASTSAMETLVLSGDAAPGGGGVTFNDLTSTLGGIVNASGQVVFFSSLNSTANGALDDTGLFRTDGSSTVTIVREGSAVPRGLGAFSSFTSSVQINSRGQVLFDAALRTTPRGSDDNQGLYLGSGSTLVEIVRQGNEVPGGDGEFSQVQDNFALTDAGFVAFSAGIQSASSTAVNAGIYLSDGVDMVQVARKGDAAGGSTIVGFSFLFVSNSPSLKSVNESGQVAYGVTLANGNTQVVVFTPELRYRSATGGSWDTVSRWTLGITPNEIHDVTIDPAVSLTVTGPANAVTVRSLVVGGANGIGTLSLAGGTITATNGVMVGAKGVLTGDGTVVGAVTSSGTVRGTNLTISGALTNNGTVLAEGLTVTGTLTNNGLVTGNGRVNAAMTSTANAEIRAEAGQTLRLGGGTLTNQGLVRVIGTPTAPAQLEVSGATTNAANTGLITASDAFVTFAGGLTNAGSLAVSTGGADVFGDINNQATGRITITGGAAATFYGDVIQNGIMRVATVGNTRSVAVFLGGFTGAGGATGGGDIFFEGDLRPGNSPAFVNFYANVSFGPGVVTFMELGRLGDGEYDRITVSGVLALDGVLDVRFLAGLEPSGGTPVTYRLLQAGALVGDFDSILLPTLTGRDWFVQRTDTSLTIGSFTVIPEPGVVGMLGVAFGLVGMRRRR